ncbi:hypothetical protein NOC27_1500 [Nitrosococcus oceani AFC27]|uniref:Transposase n=1 Tax=Nitrosococcus oceani C-27 TaxID=314279 RepID=A0A0E2Z4R1_9GAMM|nr:hypothetical protein NOC27_1500 [Nitrosococcus oceani AFC27]KFI20196.1 hypothetical protein IB75_04615 [Nitrosococcus oceani C-27]GEM21575.1 hypothetical protein NONS58_30200 [Nitrosococcus oceani]
MPREVIYERACYLTRLRYLIKDSLFKELDKPSMIVMDNASHRMLPLPTYFPGFNPTEQFFRPLVKNYLELL